MMTHWRRDNGRGDSDVVRGDVDRGSVQRRGPVDLDESKGLRRVSCAPNDPRLWGDPETRADEDVHVRERAEDTWRSVRALVIGLGLAMAVTYILLIVTR